jgi:hypothetical protein
MRTAIAAALMLAVLTGCSSDDDAFLEDVHERATAAQLEQHSDQDFIKTGKIACQKMEDGESMPDDASQLTGVEWVWVWVAAQEHLCPDVPLT